MPKFTKFCPKTALKQVYSKKTTSTDTSVVILFSHTDMSCSIICNTIKKAKDLGSEMPKRSVEYC